MIKHRILHHNHYPGIILCMRPANERWCYSVRSSFISWAHTHNRMIPATKTAEHSPTYRIPWDVFPSCCSSSYYRINISQCRLSCQALSQKVGCFNHKYDNNYGIWMLVTGSILGDNLSDDHFSNQSNFPQLTSRMAADMPSLSEELTTATLSIMAAWQSVMSSGPRNNTPGSLGRTRIAISVTPTLLTAIHVHWPP